MQGLVVPVAELTLSIQTSTWLDDAEQLNDCESKHQILEFLSLLISFRPYWPLLC